MKPFTDDTQSIGKGPLTLDVAFARRMGVTNEEAQALWNLLSVAIDNVIQVAASRAGRTETCRICECHTPPGGCIHCEAGYYVSPVEVVIDGG